MEWSGMELNGVGWNEIEWKEGMRRKGKFSKTEIHLVIVRVYSVIIIIRTKSVLVRPLELVSC